MSQPLKLGRLQHDLLDSLRAGPMTTRALADDIGSTALLVGASMRKLRARGLARQTGRHLTLRGRPVVYDLTHKGRLALDSADACGRNDGRRAMP